MFTYQQWQSPCERAPVRNTINTSQNQKFSSAVMEPRLLIRSWKIQSIYFPFKWSQEFTHGGVEALGWGRRAAGDLARVPALHLALGSGTRQFDGCCRSLPSSATVQRVTEQEKMLRWWWNDRQLAGLSGETWDLFLDSIPESTLKFFMQKSWRWIQKRKIFDSDAVSDVYSLRQGFPKKHHHFLWIFHRCSSSESESLGFLSRNQQRWRMEKSVQLLHCQWPSGDHNLKNSVVGPKDDGSGSGANNFATDVFQRIKKKRLNTFSWEWLTSKSVSSSYCGITNSLDGCQYFSSFPCKPIHFLIFVTGLRSSPGSKVVQEQKIEMKTISDSKTFSLFLSCCF